MGKSLNGRLILSHDRAPTQQCLAPLRFPFFFVVSLLQTVEIQKKGADSRRDKKGRRKDSFDDFDDYSTKPKTEYTVTTTEELPEGATLDEPEEEAKKKKKKGGFDDDDYDLDLSKPLRPGEGIARQLTYAEIQAAKAAEARKAAEKEKEKSKRDSKHSSSRHSSSRRHKDDKEREKDKDRHRSSRSHRDKDKEKVKDAKKSSSSSSGGSTAAAAAASNPLDIFDPLSAQSPKAHLQSPSASSAPASTSAAPEAKESSKSKSSSSSSGSGLREIYEDSTVRISSQVRAGPSSGDRPVLLAMLIIKARSSSSRSKRVSITVEVANSRTHRITAVQNDRNDSKGRTMDNGVVIAFSDVKPGTEFKEVIRIDWLAPFSGPSKIVLSVSHKDDQGKGKDRKPAELPLPVSSFIVPKRLAASELASIMTQAGPGAPTALAAKEFKTSKQSKEEISSLLRKIGEVLHVCLIDATNFNAMYYGTLAIDSSHVALLVKCKRDDLSQMKIEIKTPSQSLSNALLDEVAELLRRA